MRRGTRHVVAAYSGVIGGMGFGGILKRGETLSFPLLLANYRCDGGPGSAIPPGTYGVRVVSGAGKYDYSLNRVANPGQHLFFSDEALITIP